VHVVLEATDVGNIKHQQYVTLGTYDSMSNIDVTNTTLCQIQMLQTLH